MLKLSSFIKDDIMKEFKLSGKNDIIQKFKLAGIIITTGIFIVAMVSVSIAANSFFIRATNTRLDKIEARQASFEIEMKKELTEIKEDITEIKDLIKSSSKQARKH